MPIAVTSFEVISTNAAGDALNGATTIVGQSPDGTKILFYSGATNAVTGDTNGFIDLFLKDLTTGVITRLSLSSIGLQLNNNVTAARFSPDGTKVLFETLATNVVTGDTNGASDVFVITLGTGAITRLGVNEFGVQANGGILRADFSADGAQVVFCSRATNLSGGDSDASADVYVQNLGTGVITLVSTSAAGVKGNALSGSQGVSVFSPDGTLVAFTSTSTNLVPGDTNASYDIFIKNLVTGAITRANVSAAGVEANGAFFAPGSFSADGTKLLIRADSANNLMPGVSSGAIFVKDLATGALTLVTADADGVPANSYSYPGNFSPDGRYVVFYSNATNLVPGDTNGQPDVFIKDLLTGAVTRVSALPDGTEANAYSYTPMFSPDGLSVLFWTFASNLASNVDTTRGSWVIARIAQTASDSADGLTGTATADTLEGLGGNDVLSGFGGDDMLDGGAGDDALTGGSGDDYLRGGAGADTMVGGLGNDTYVVTDAGDTADETGGDGVDLVMSLRSFTLGAGLENLTLTASGGNIDGTGNALDNVILGNAFDNILTGLDGADTLSGNGRNDTLYGGNGNDILDGGQHDDQLFGGANHDLLTGGTGNDLLDGGTGADDMSGGAGNDTYIVDNGLDTGFEAANDGIDTVESAVHWALEANFENLTLTGTANLYGTGNALRNTILGNDGNNVISAGAELDTVSGGAGDDRLYGEAGNDVLNGDSGLDQLFGGEGADTLNGGADDDILAGGAGADKLIGGAGADRFTFSQADITTPVGRDEILDLVFADGDVIDLSGIDANITLGADGDQAFVWAAKFTKVAGQAVLAYAGGITTLSLDVNGDGVADFKIAITGDHTGTTGNLYTGAGDANGGWVL